MRASEDQDEAIPYRADFSTEPADRVSSEDQEDYPTLKQIFNLILEAERKANSMDTLRKGHVKLNTDQLLVGYQFALDEVIEPLKIQLMEVIGEIKLKQRGIINE